MTTAPINPSPPFSLSLALTTLLITGLALAITAAAWRWSAMPTTDAFDNAWLYANLALLFTTLTFWPGISLRNPTPARAALLWQIPTIIVPALPALIIAAFLSNIPLSATLPAIFLQLAMILLALGAITWHPRIPSPIIAGTLAAIAFLLPLFAYLWIEFLPLAPDGFIDLAPALTMYKATTNPAAAPIWPTIFCALAGTALTLSSPAQRSMSQPQK